MLVMADKHITHVSNLYTPGQPAVANQDFTHAGKEYMAGKPFPYGDLDLRPGQLQQYHASRLIRFTTGKPVALKDGERLYTEAEVARAVQEKVSVATEKLKAEHAAELVAIRASISKASEAKSSPPVETSPKA